MKKLALISVLFILSCSNNETGMDSHLSTEQVVIVQAENQKKLVGK